MKDGQIIIVRKRRAHGHGHHGGAWKVAYADFVTALMAFFLVLWIVGQSAQIKAAVAGYFKDPGLFEQENRGQSPIEGGELALDPEAPPTPPADELRLEDRAALEETASRIRDLLREAPDMKALEEQIEITVTKEGLRIELLESRDGESTFFDTGSASLKQYTGRVLAIIAGELGKLKNTVIIEGHTDSRPYGSERYTNWELSADRANAARRVMENGGLRQRQVQGIRGYADTHLRNTNDASDGSNRRVSIIVQNLWESQQLPEGLKGDVTPTEGGEKERSGR